MGSREVQRALREICFAIGPKALAPAAQAHGASTEDVRALAQIEARTRIYRRLVRHNLFGVIHSLLERTYARSEEVKPGAFDELIGRFLEEKGPLSFSLRAIPSEFIEWGHDAIRDAISEEVAALGRLENAEFRVAIAEENAGEAIDAAPSPADSLVFSSAHQFVDVPCAVHEGSPAVARAASLMVYRDNENTVRVLELSLLHHAVLTRLVMGKPMGEAMREAAECVGPVGENDLVEVASLLSGLKGAGFLRGIYA